MLYAKKKIVPLNAVVLGFKTKSRTHTDGGNMLSEIKNIRTYLKGIRSLTIMIKKSDKMSRSCISSNMI